MESITETQPYLIIKDILTLILTITGLVIAGVGLFTWKKQIKGTKEFDTAYSLNYSVLKLREAIKNVRNPAIWLPETDRAKKYTKERNPERTNDFIESNSHVLVYEMRWEEIIKASTEIESHLLAAELLWGKEIVNLIRPLNTKVTELNIALRQNFNPDLRTKNQLESYDVIYNSSSENEDDKFSKEINTIINNVSTFLKKKAPLD